MTKSFDSDLKIFKSKSNDSMFLKINGQNHLILIEKYSRDLTIKT